MVIRPGITALVQGDTVILVRVDYIRCGIDGIELKVSPVGHTIGTVTERAICKNARNKVNAVFGVPNPTIERVICNDPATVVIWSDGTKTVVKCQDGDEYDPEKGLALCVAKKYFGNTGKYNDVFRQLLPLPEIPEIYEKPVIEHDW